jgi:cytosine/adenosine deaminase-related metal-dependent hydrolase
MSAFRWFAGFSALLAVLAVPGGLLGSDILLVHGHIYTGNPKVPWAQALAVTGTRIDAVGTDEEILARRQPNTEVIDLQGRTVIPGISDSHTHLWLGATALHGFNLSTPQASITPEQSDLLIEKARNMRGATLRTIFCLAGQTLPRCSPERPVMNCWIGRWRTGR